MTERQRLVKLIDDKLDEHLSFSNLPEILADHLIANGVGILKEGAE